jgi:ribosomal protein L12E/L44/L45/RPP1/RPP2
MGQMKKKKNKGVLIWKSDWLDIIVFAGCMAVSAGVATVLVYCISYLGNVFEDWINNMLDTAPAIAPEGGPDAASTTPPSAAETVASDEEKKEENLSEDNKMTTFAGGLLFVGLYTFVYFVGRYFFIITPVGLFNFFGI